MAADAGESKHPPETFVEMQQQQAEHLGTLQVGTFAVYRDVVKCRIIDETGEQVARVDLRTHDLPPDVNRLIWDLNARLSGPIADLLRAESVAALSQFIALSAALAPADSGTNKAAES